MCTDYVHEQAMKVVQSLSVIITELQSSKRKCDKGFKKSFKIMIRKTFGIGEVNYQLFIIQEKQAPFCAAAWEIIGTFDGLKEDLFYFIKGKMFEHPKTNWYPVVYSMMNKISTVYESNEIKVLSFATGIPNNLIDWPISV